MAQSAAVTRRQMIEAARQAGLTNQWDEAISLNQQLIERMPRDAEAHNRLGRAFLALGRHAEATDAYSDALRADPANLIARRNLQRLETIRHRGDPALAAAGTPAADAEAEVTPRRSVFIEEVGKTWVDELVNPPAIDVLVDVYPATELELNMEGNRLIVTTRDGRRLGEIEAKTAERVIELMTRGNRYEAYSLGLSAQSLRVILREVFHDPAQADTFSFPRQITSRAYLRERDLLRQRDEADFFFSDDEDEEDERTAGEADDEEPSESDQGQFADDTVTVVEEEDSTL
ncbi:MAG: tetratricopeptide repeat protein [Chloroflexia bacterium]|nr:tetratricopeptide repeat protein [Chloroflexia bacterium]